MEQTELIIAHLRIVVSALGTSGGLMGPSLYDTAQVLRLAPPERGIERALEWVIEQQHLDGGWGNPALPFFRDVPTLAAILALHAHRWYESSRTIIDSGLLFLQRASAKWAGTPPDDIPAGIELILPYLLREAEHAGLAIDPQPYQSLIALGEQRRRLIQRLPALPGTTHVHSWEAWGEEPDRGLLDPSGGVGHSPAATAAWIHAAADRADLAQERAAAQSYLAQAAVAAGSGIPGVVPTAWPINRFEQAFGLYMLLVGGLLHHPRLQDIIQPQIQDMAESFQAGGVGFSDWFMPDGDDTAAALAVLHSSGYDVDPDFIRQFAKGDHFYSWPYEMQPSISVTAHAVHLLALCDTAPPAAIDYLLTRQGSDGRWCSDKWNSSWLYTTWHVMIALLDANVGHSAVQRALDRVLAEQDPCGGWGWPEINAEETAYGVMALRMLLNAGWEHPAIEPALMRAERWMLNHYMPFRNDSFACWLAKDTYRASRLSQIIELAATFPMTLAHPQLSHILGGTV